MPKYSSFKNQQILTENFRRFLDEDSDAEENEHDRKNVRADRKDADELDDEGDKRGADKMRDDADYEEKHVNEVDGGITASGLYRTSKPEMEDMLMEMAYEFENQLSHVSSPKEAIAAAVDAMEKRVDDGEFSSGKWSSEQASKYHSAQQFLTGREAFRKMMSDVGEFILDISAPDGERSWDLPDDKLDSSDIADAVKQVLQGAEQGQYSMSLYRENKKKQKGKKTSLLEIRRRRSRARRKQNK
jgi:hypothetical protein